MLVAEVPVVRLWSFLEGLRNSGDNGQMIIPVQRPDDDVVKQLARKALGGKKGAGWGARLLEQCPPEDLPKSAVEFLLKVYAVFPLPAGEAPEAQADANAAAPVAQAPPKPSAPSPPKPTAQAPLQPAAPAPPTPAA